MNIKNRFVATTIIALSTVLIAMVICIAVCGPEYGRLIAVNEEMHEKLHKESVYDTIINNKLVGDTVLNLVSVDNDILLKQSFAMKQYAQSLKLRLNPNDLSFEKASLGMASGFKVHLQEAAYIHNKYVLCDFQPTNPQRKVTRELICKGPYAYELQSLPFVIGLSRRKSLPGKLTIVDMNAGRLMLANIKSVYKSDTTIVEISCEDLCIVSKYSIHGLSFGFPLGVQYKKNGMLVSELRIR